MSRFTPIVGWPAFFAWSVAGGLWGFSFLSFAGLYTLPLAVAATWFLVRNAPERRDGFGAAIGAGGLLIGIGILNLGYRACEEVGAVTILSSEGSESCGGWSPTPFLVAGAALVVVSLITYLRLRTSAAR